MQLAKHLGAGKIITMGSNEEEEELREWFETGLCFGDQRRGLSVEREYGTVIVPSARAVDDRLGG